MISLLLAASASFAPLQSPRAVALEREDRPRLAVVLVVDQLIPENLRRLEPVFEGGLARLLRQGLVFERAQLAHGLSYTAPGHFSAGSGMLPSRHGVVANGWLDTEAKRSVYCTEDDDVRLVDSDGVHEDSKSHRRSPKLSQVSGIADFIEEAFPGVSRTISISGKDRAAVGTAGQRPDFAFWWDKKKASGFVSSTWYDQSLPPWVIEWNESWASRVSGETWTELRPELKERLRELGTAEDDREGEYLVFDKDRSFPHPMPVLPSPTEEAVAKDRAAAARKLAGTVYTSPWIDQFAIELARRAIPELKLGADEATDVLCLSLTAVDTVGHLFGPYSRELTDVMLRIDALLGELFADLDQQVGEGRWVLGFTSDHGVLELPEERVARGEGGGRISRRVIDASMRDLTEALDKTYGAGLFWRRDSSGVYFDRAALRERELDFAEVRTFARDHLLGQDNDLWHHAFTAEEVIEGRGAVDPWLPVLAASYYEGRSPDVFLMGPPWHILGDVAGTTHGSPYPYDRRIPLIFYGPGVERGLRYDAAYSIDLVPTLLDLLGVDAQRTFDGRSKLGK